MKQLTPKEIQFVKETGFTPTVWQCNEWKRTPFKNFEEAEKVANEKYGVDLSEFINKNLGVNLGDYDGISLEFVATYLLYTFFTKEQLENLTNEAAIEFLQDYRYFFGFRKWYAGDMHYRLPHIDEAIEVYNGERVFYLQDDGNVWNTRKDEIEGNDYFKDKKFLEI